jgi:hypothetical protein
MKKTSIHPADAADDMQRCYDREVSRHHQQRRKTINKAISWGVVVALVALAGWGLLKRGEKQNLPKAAFEVAAEQKAKAAKTAAAKPKADSTATRTAGKSSSGSTKTPSAAPAPVGYTVHLGVTASGYRPSRITAPAGVPVAITLDGIKGGDVVGFELPKLHITANNDGQAVTIMLPAMKPGTYRFSSFVGTIEGTLVVK